MSFNQILIVEGRSDTENLRRILGPEVKTIETGGSSIDQKVLDRIKDLSDQELVIFTDPDFQGNRIRRIISEVAPNAKHAHLTRKEGEPDGKGTLGIEHADAIAIKRALEGMLTPGLSTSENDKITQSQLRELNLIDGPRAADLRMKVAESLRLGQVNGKQFLKRLNLFGISFAELKRSVQSHLN
ncbi:MAG: ribonuclease M5 [Lactobacillaceae bacterium]|jgi:ribonuclease M5|nr:ribonuclease M5 [Lactobacillaceae bacterium]